MAAEIEDVAETEEPAELAQAAEADARRPTTSTGTTTSPRR